MPPQSGEVTSALAISVKIIVAVPYVVGAILQGESAAGWLRGALLKYTWEVLQEWWG